MTQTYFELQQEEYSGCLHRNLEVFHVGLWTFYEGEVFDNIQEQVFCMDCMQPLTETEVRETWNTRSAAPPMGSF